MCILQGTTQFYCILLQQRTALFKNAADHTSVCLRNVSDEPLAALLQDVCNPLCRCGICKRLQRDFKLLLFVRLHVNICRGNWIVRVGSQQVPHVVCNAAATLPRLTQAHIKRETQSQSLQGGT